MAALNNTRRHSPTKRPDDRPPRVRLRFNIESAGAEERTPAARGEGKRRARASFQICFPADVSRVEPTAVEPCRIFGSPGRRPAGGSRARDEFLALCSSASAEYLIAGTPPRRASGGSLTDSRRLIDWRESRERTPVSVSRGSRLYV